MTSTKRAKTKKTKTKTKDKTKRIQREIQKEGEIKKATLLHGEGTTLQEEDEGRKSIQPGRLTQGPTKASFHNNFQHQCHHRYPRHHHHHHHHNVGCHLATDGGKNSVVDVEGVRRQDQGPKTLQVYMSVMEDVPEKKTFLGNFFTF